MAENTVETTNTTIAARPEAAPSATREETRYLIPPVDIFETKDGLIVQADLPGVDKDGVDVRVDNGILTISGRVTHGAQGESIRNEFMLLDHFRQFELSDQVAVDKISAELKNGVLRIHLPRVEAAKPRQIAVKVA